MARNRSRSRSRSRSPLRRKRYDDPRGKRRERRSPGPTGLLVRNISLSARSFAFSIFYFIVLEFPFFF